MAIKPYTTQAEYSAIEQKLKNSLSLPDVFFEDVSAVLMLKALRNVVTSGRPFQKNVADLKDFFPTVIRSEYFKNWRYKFKATHNSQNGHIIIRPNYQNSVEYGQITFDGAIQDLKSTLNENDKLIIFKKKDSDIYEVFKVPVSVTSFDETLDFVAINPANTNDKTYFNAPHIEINTTNKKYPLNQILYGPPGTGKTHNAINHALAIATGKDLNELIEAEKSNSANRIVAKDEFNTLVETGQIQFVTFHQSYSYEDFVEGIKPIVNANGQVEYEIKDGIFKKMCQEAEGSGKNHVLIIDEINRGNISKIFGELITLIENSKRIGEKEALKVKLTYSGTNDDDFGVPNNLFLIGTMNSADKSIALVDTALRRRFEFLEYTADSTLLNTNIEGIDLQKLLKTINERIEILLDKNHLIGHAYLINVTTKNQLCAVFRNGIIPLLEEYFYADYEKIQFVLGDNPEFNKIKTNRIIINNSQADQRNLFGTEIDGFEEKTIYHLNENIELKKYDDISPTFFISIYEKTQSTD